jgi:hypothetical protein
MAQCRHMTALFLLMAAAVWGGDAETPRLEVRAAPKVSLAPPGGVRAILLTAEIVGPETEEYYCPEIVWVWPDGTHSSEESDCDPFPKRTYYPRRFTRRIAVHAFYRDYRVCVLLRKGGEAFDRSCTRYTVR